MWIMIPALLAVLGVLLLAGYYFYRIKYQALPRTGKPAADTLHRFYNLRADSLTVSFGRVGNNQNLSALLSGYVSPGLVDRIQRETGDIFDVRKIHSGNTFARISAKKDPKKLMYFVYEINSIDFVVYDFRDSLRVYRDRKKVTVAVKSAAGVIRGSLWNTFEKSDLNISLALDLSEVFAWTVDFYGLQNGDAFKVVYEEMYVDGRMIGIDRVISAWFRTGEKENYAFLMESKGHKAYYDENGQSLQRTFLKAPLRFSRISSRFSRSRKHPILRISRPHFGVDYSAPSGTPVEALGEGKITEMGWKGGYGRFIAIRHNSVYSSSYAHLSGYAKNLKPGSAVRQGQIIGYVGSSGLSTGPHLDFRVYRNGAPVDPLHLESPPALPVDGALMPVFRQLVAKEKPRLDGIRL
jgi:murein DD-endopeptidase MepM/ murein hydrolase activator NlpD